MKAKMVTTTLTDTYDAPEISILEGHHDLKTFNKAFIEEGWTQEPWPSDYVSHEYWIKLPNGKWECSNKNDSRAIPVTIATWEGPAPLPLAKGPAPHLN